MDPRDSSSAEGGGTSKKPACQISFLWGNQAYKGTSYHFNERGILVLCAQPAPLKTKIKLQVRIPGVKNPVRVDGEVVWTNIHGHADSISPRGMGIRFVNVEADLERLLSQAAERYGSSRSAYSCYFE